jgi:hypothetical protein
MKLPVLLTTLTLLSRPDIFALDPAEERLGFVALCVG